MNIPIVIPQHRLDSFLIMVSVIYPFFPINSALSHGSRMIELHLGYSSATTKATTQDSRFLTFYMQDQRVSRLSSLPLRIFLSDRPVVSLVVIHVACYLK